MQYFTLIKRLCLAIAVVAGNLALSACGNLSSPVDQAYYTGSNAFSIPGGYTRTIFSSNNF